MFESTINDVESEEHQQAQIKDELTKIFNEDDLEDLFGKTESGFDAMLEMPFLVYDTFFIYQRWTRLWRLFIKKNDRQPFTTARCRRGISNIDFVSKTLSFSNWGYSGMMDASVDMIEGHRTLHIITIVEHYQFLNDLLKEQKCEHNRFQSADELRRTLQDLWIVIKNDNTGNTHESKTLPNQVDIDDFFDLLHKKCRNATSNV